MRRRKRFTYGRVTGGNRAMTCAVDVSEAVGYLRPSPCFFLVRGGDDHGDTHAAPDDGPDRLPRARFALDRRVSSRCGRRPGERRVVPRWGRPGAAGGASPPP